jgi:hypothetical protein
LAKNKKHIDDLFKDNLQGSQLPLDGSEWDKLFNDLHPKKKKGFAWWWFTIGILVVSAAGLLYSNFNSKSTAHNTPVVLQDAQKSLNERINNKENREERIEQRNKSIEEKIDDRKENKTKEIEKTAASQDALISDNAQKDKVQKEASGEKRTEKKGDDAGSKSNGKTKPITQTINVANTVGQKRTTRADLVSVYAKTQINIPWRNNTFILGGRRPENTSVTISCPPMFGSNDTLDPTKRFLDPYVGITLGVSRLNQNVKSDIANYTTYRNGNEGARMLPNLGLDIGSGFKGFEIASGVKYQEKGQQSNPNYTYEIYDSIRRVDSNGDVFYLPWNYRDTTINGVPSPTYRYITLPISFGKKLYDSRQFDLTVGINTNVQYLVGGTGTILNENLSLTNVQRLSAFNRLSLTYGGYINVGYALNDRMKLKLLMRIDADALDMMKHNDISQKLSGFGTDLSLQFKLKK